EGVEEDADHAEIAAEYGVATHESDRDDDRAPEDALHKRVSWLEELPMSCLALAPREPQLPPRDLAGFNHRADLAFARRQRRATRLHLEKYDPPHLTRREPVEHDEVDR